MRKLALVLALLPIAACSTTNDVTEEQRAFGIKSVAELSSDYESATYWTGVRQSADGRSNAFARDIGKIGSFIDRHVWNYDANDPYVNYPTDTTRLGHLGRAGISTVSAVPILGDIWDMFR